MSPDSTSSPARPRRLIWRWLRAPILSPAGFLVRAAILALAYLAAHLSGLRACTSFLSGTSPASDGFQQTPAVLGAVYVTLYFAFTVLVPVLVLAAGLLWLWNTLAPHAAKRPSPSDERPSQPCERPLY